MVFKCSINTIEPFHLMFYPQWTLDYDTDHNHTQRKMCAHRFTEWAEANGVEEDINSKFGLSILAVWIPCQRYANTNTKRRIV